MIRCKLIFLDKIIFWWIYCASTVLHTRQAHENLWVRGTSHYGHQLSRQGILAIWWKAKVCPLDLHIKGQQTRASKTSTWEHFFGVLVPKVCLLEESLDFHKYCGQVFFHWTTFLSKLIQSLQFIYPNGLLFYLLEGSLSKIL